MKILDYTIKTIKHPLLWGGLVGLFSACTNLDVDINSKYTEMPENESAIEANVYYNFRAALGQRYNEAQSLGQTYVALSFSGDYVDGQRYFHPTTHNYSPDDIGSTYWVDLSAGITKCNNILSEIQDNESMASSIANVRAMRAFYHYILMDSYGDVPILDHLYGEGEEIKRQSRASVAKWIESELKEIMPDLSADVTASTYGKPTRWMAEALLCKLYLNWPVYTKDVTEAGWTYGDNEKLDACVAYCDSIISSGKFSLTGGTDPAENSYRQKFYPDNGYQIEDFIYAMPYDAATDYAADKTSPSKYSTNSGNGLLYGRYRSWRKATGGTDEEGNSRTYWGGSASLSMAGIFSLVPWVADLFTLPGDNRNDVILRDTVQLYSQKTRQPVGKWFFKDAPVVLTHDITLINSDNMDAGATVEGWSQGYKSIKFWLDCDEYDQYTRYQSNDVPIFRLADVILMKAEALTRKWGSSSEARSLFNEIRGYNNAPLLTANPTLDDIFEERIREFLDENWDRNDFIRFSRFETGYKSMPGFPTLNTDPTHRILPIPTDMLNTDSNWSQNAGY